jgi:hypothetical protein
MACVACERDKICPSKHLCYTFRLMKSHQLAHETHDLMSRPHTLSRCDAHLWQDAQRLSIGAKFCKHVMLDATYDSID